MSVDDEFSSAKLTSAGVLCAELWSLMRYTDAFKRVTKESIRTLLKNTKHSLL